MSEKIIKAADAHAHINPIRGIGVKKIINKFKNMGGWFIALVSLPPYHYGIKEFNIEAFRRSFELLIKVASDIEKEGVKCRLICGFHPAIVDKLRSMGVSTHNIKKLGIKVIDLICEYIKTQKVYGIGEVGVQHYPSSIDNIKIAFEIAKYALERASELDVIVHLHIKPDIETIRRFKELAEDLAIKHEKVIFHHMSLNVVNELSVNNFSFTIVGKYEILKSAVRMKPNYLVESDYLDDPKRPGAVIVPWAIPRNWRKLLMNNLCSLDYAETINIKNIKRIYEVEP